jgi:hypothetical protein
VTATAPEPVATRTIAQQVLLAAQQLELEGSRPFTAEALIVTAWRGNPTAFGLRGYADQFPDSNRVLSVIMGERGLTRQGLLEKVGVKLYTLTDRGRKALTRSRKELAEEDGEPTAKKLPHAVDRLLVRLSTSLAVSRFRFGAKEMITLPVACDFWGVADSRDMDALRRAAENTRQLLEKASALFPDVSAELSSGRVLHRRELDLMLAVQGFLSEQFSRYLNPPKPRRPVAAE